MLPSTAADRGGIQPVVVGANGTTKADVQAGQPVTLEVVAQAPPGTGTIIAAHWDFEGDGTWVPIGEAINGREATVRVATTYIYDRPGTYFPTVQVTSHRDGDPGAKNCRIDNLARARRRDLTCRVHQVPRQ